ncbi:hypothetical protein CPB86DRAFT_316762 [Serendipita vermifera]|nr:hypothetical protein CPB86DRAFT_316762 [Serendipita vermifera]
MNLPTKKKYTKRSLLFPSITWVVVMAVISNVKRIWKPQPCLTPESVSGFYGPGAYWGWILTILSAIADMVLSNEDDGISPDFVAACLYTLVAMVDTQFRLNITRHIKNELQLQAGLHVIYVAWLCSSLAFVLGQYIYESSHDVISFVIATLSGPWKFRLWAPFMLLTTMHTLTIGHTVVGVTPETFAIDAAVLAYTAMIFFATGWFIKLVLWPFLFCFLVYEGGKPVRRGKYLWPISAPHTESSILEMDQIASLMTTIVLLSIYWKAWRPAMHFLVYVEKAIRPRR